MRLISSLIEKYGLVRFFTLTLNRDIIPEKVDPWDYIHYPWSKFRKRMKRRYDFKFVAILEGHKNKNYPHIHGFTNVWMKQAEWSEVWSECGGGVYVWVEKVENPIGVTGYVSKTLEVARYVGKEQLLDGYKQKKGHRTLWRSEGLKADFELDTTEEWCIIKDGVFTEEGELTDFYSKKGVLFDAKEEQQRKDVARPCSPVPE